MQYSENNSALIFKAAEAEEEQYCRTTIMSGARVKSPALRKGKSSELLKNEQL